MKETTFYCFNFYTFNAFQCMTSANMYEMLNSIRVIYKGTGKNNMHIFNYNLKHSIYQPNTANDKNDIIMPFSGLQNFTIIYLIFVYDLIKESINLNSYKKYI